MLKKSNVLVQLPGCLGCGRLCKYNGRVADPVYASHFSWENPYACNSRTEGFTVDEGDDHGSE